MMLKSCPFCGNHLSIRAGVNGYGRCDTEGCWIKDRFVVVPLDDERQTTAWNCRATPLASTGAVSGAERDVLSTSELALTGKHGGAQQKAAPSQIYEPYKSCVWPSMNSLPRKKGRVMSNLLANQSKPDVGAEISILELARRAYSGDQCLGSEGDILTADRRMEFTWSRTWLKNASAASGEAAENSGLSASVTLVSLGSMPANEQTNMPFTAKAMALTTSSIGRIMARLLRFGIRGSCHESGRPQKKRPAR